MNYKLRIQFIKLHHLGINQAISFYCYKCEQDFEAFFDTNNKFIFPVCSKETALILLDFLHEMFKLSDQEKSTLTNLINNSELRLNLNLQEYNIIETILSSLEDYYQKEPFYEQFNAFKQRFMDCLRESASFPKSVIF